MNVLRYLYNHNPFYLLSAVLILIGLKSVFPSGDAAEYDWLLMGVIVGYVGILTATAVLIVRTGGVWEDTRTILLLVVFLLLALSVNFDEKVIARPGDGVLLLSSGLLFALLASEVLLRGLRIRLLALYRLPYYAMLAAFFLYPILLTGLLRLGSVGTADWGCLAFPLLVGLLLLTLLPAVLSGPDSVRDSGTPWRWPWLPWILFGFLALCASGRAYYLTISFGLGGGRDTIFAPYFLVPIVLAACVLLLEGARASGHGPTCWVALLVPLLLPIVSLLAPEAYDVEALRWLELTSPAKRKFLQTVTAALASPAFITLLGLVGFYAYAWLRRLALAEVGLLASLLALSVVSSTTQSFDDLSAPRLLPIILVLGLEVVCVLRRPLSLRWMAVTGLALLAATHVSGFHWLWWDIGFVPLHIAIAAALATGWLSTDRFARAIRIVGSVILTVACTLVVYAPLGSGGPADFTKGIPGWCVPAYAVAVLGVQLGYWRLLRERQLGEIFAWTVVLCAPRACLAALRGLSGLWRWILSLKWGLGTWTLLGGVLLLILAVAISFAKAGLFRRLRLGLWSRLGGRLRPKVKGRASASEEPPADRPDDSILEDP